MTHIKETPFKTVYLVRRNEHITYSVTDFTCSNFLQIWVGCTTTSSFAKKAGRL